MENENECCKDWGKKSSGNSANSCGFVYVLTIIGAAVFYIQQATTFWMGVLGFLKALIWPALLMYKVMGLLGM